MRVKRASIPLAIVFLLAACSVSSALLIPWKKTSFFTLIDAAKDNPNDFTNAIKTFLDDIGNLLPDLLTSISNAVAVLSNPTPPSIDVTQKATCTICMSLVTALFTSFIADYKTTETALFQLCVNVLKVEDPNTNGAELCKFVYVQAPVINKTIRAANPTGLFEPTFFTVCLFQNACSKQLGTNNVLMAPNCHTKPKPTEAELQSLEVAKQAAFTISHVTDIHLEPEYAAGSNTDCHLWVCCRESNGPGTAGAYGDYHCNIPPKTVEIVLKKFFSLNSDINIFSGDVAPHAVWNETEKSQYDCTRITAQLMKQAIGSSNTNVLTAIGNHETYPTNQLSVAHSEYTKNLLTMYLNEWGTLNGFGPDQIKTMLAGGYYSVVKPFNGKKNIRVISASSNYAYTNNFWNPLNFFKSQEVKNMKVAIETLLKDACRTQSELVILIIHHSMGDIDFIEQEGVYWQNLIVKYAACIKLVISGHSHIDEFRLIKNGDNVPVHIVHVLGSVDTSYFHNPCIRKFYIDKTTEEVLDYDHYCLNLKDLPADIDPQLQLSYSARKEYGLADMSPLAFEDLLCRFSTEQNTLLAHMNHGSGGAATAQSCNANCTKDHTCRQLHALNTHYAKCSGTSQDLYLYAFSFGKAPYVSAP